MKLVLPKKPLKEALKHLSKVIPGKITLPILGTVKIESSNKSVMITGTNLDEILTWKINDVEGEGSCIINLKELKEYLKNSGDSKTVQLESLEDQISAVSFAGNIPVVKQFKAYPEKDWPMLQKSSGNGNQITNKVFDNIQKAIPAASKDNTRKILQSVLLEEDAVVATSGKQLVKFYCPTGLEDNAVIPVTRFIKSPAFAGNDGTISIYETDGIKYCSFETENWIYSAKCPIGTYPNYKQVIPTGCSNSFEFTSNEMADLSVSLSHMTFDSEFKAIHILSTGGITNILSETMDSYIKAGKQKGNQQEFTLSVNRDLLLRALELGFNKFKFNDGYSPLVASRDGSNDLMICMPLRNGPEIDKLKDAVKQLLDNKPDITNQEIPQTNINHKEADMPEETKQQNGGFQVVDGAEQNPFEELLISIAETRDKAREVLDLSNGLAKQVKNVQRAQKMREREFNNTRELLGKLKKVSGF